MIRNEVKCPSTLAISLLHKSDREYWVLPLDSKHVYSLLEEIMLVFTDVYEWLGEISIKNSNGTEAFQNPRTHNDK